MATNYGKRRSFNFITLKENRHKANLEFRSLLKKSEFEILSYLGDLGKVPFWIVYENGCHGFEMAVLHCWLIKEDNERCIIKTI